MCFLLSSWIHTLGFHYSEGSLLAHYQSPLLYGFFAYFSIWTNKISSLIYVENISNTCWLQFWRPGASFYLLKAFLSQTDVCGLCCRLKPCGCEQPVLSSEAMLMFLACVVAKGYDGACGSGSGRGPCSCSWSILPPETMLRHMACANGREHVVVCGPSCCQKPCISPWSVLSLTVKCKAATFAMILMTTDP